MKYILIALFLVGCASKKPSHEKTLEELLKPIAGNEASIIANDAIDFSQTLKERYDLIPYANFNNFLVNIGIKERGLCWQLAYDMYHHLKPKNYNVDYYIGGANINHYWSEHNAVVLTCKGCDFKDGVLLDPWRNGGELFYSKIGKDEDFSWSQRGGKR